MPISKLLKLHRFSLYQASEGFALFLGSPTDRRIRGYVSFVYVFIIKSSPGGEG